MASGAHLAVDVVKSLYDKLKVETKNTEDSAREFMKSIKFDLYNESSLCKSLKGMEMAYFDTFVNCFCERHEFPQNIIDSILEGKHCKENMAVFKEFQFTAGKSNQVLYMRTVTRKRGGRGGGIDFACVLICLKFKLSKEEVATVKANSFLKLFGIRRDTTEMKDRTLSQEQKEYITNYFRAKAKLEVQAETDVEKDSA